MQINLPKTALKGPVSLEWKIPRWSNTIERNRARTYFQAYAAACALHFAEKALVEIRAGQHQDVGVVRGARRGHRLRVHRGRARRAQPPHGHPGREDRELPPVPADAVERQPARQLRHPGPYEDAVQGQPIFEENDREHFKGIDIMRTVRSFDPCLPCGVHMYLGDGKTLEMTHSPTQSVTGE